MSYISRTINVVMSFVQPKAILVIRKVLIFRGGRDTTIWVDRLLSLPPRPSTPYFRGTHPDF